MVDERGADGLRERLRAELRVAMKERDKAAVAALRAALGVIDNAEAADLSRARGIEPGHIAGGVAGLGAGEVARQQLPDSELVEMLQEEVAQWESTARECERVNRTDDAARLRAEIAALRPFLAERS
jgi:uncharacterized protein YqeY